MVTTSTSLLFPNPKSLEALKHCGGACWNVSQISELLKTLVAPTSHLTQSKSQGSHLDLEAPSILLWPHNPMPRSLLTQLPCCFSNKPGTLLLFTVLGLEGSFPRQCHSDGWLGGNNENRRVVNPITGQTSPYPARLIWGMDRRPFGKCFESPKNQIILTSQCNIHPFTEHLLGTYVPDISLSARDTVKTSPPQGLRAVYLEDSQVNNDKPSEQCHRTLKRFTPTRWER